MDTRLVAGLLLYPLLPVAGVGVVLAWTARSEPALSATLRTLAVAAAAYLLGERWWSELLQLTRYCLAELSQH